MEELEKVKLMEQHIPDGADEEDEISGEIYLLEKIWLQNMVMEQIRLVMMENVIIIVNST